MVKRSIRLDPSKNPCRDCLLACFIEIQNVIRSFVWKSKGPRTATASLKKKSQAGSTKPPGTKMYYRGRHYEGAVIVPGQDDSQIGEVREARNRLPTQGPLSQHDGATAVHGERGSPPISDHGQTGQSHREQGGLLTNPTSHHPETQVCTENKLRRKLRLISLQPLISKDFLNRTQKSLTRSSHSSSAVTNP